LRFGCRFDAISSPGIDYEFVSKSYVERQNANIGMGIRRFTYLTNAFDVKIDYHAPAIALYFNSCKVLPWRLLLESQLTFGL
jgi:hypothetical protein